MQTTYIWITVCYRYSNCLKEIIHDGETISRSRNSHYGRLFCLSLLGICSRAESQCKNTDTGSVLRKRCEITVKILLQNFSYGLEMNVAKSLTLHGKIEIGLLFWPFIIYSKAIQVGAAGASPPILLEVAIVPSGPHPNNPVSTKVCNLPPPPRQYSFYLVEHFTPNWIRYLKNGMVMAQTDTFKHVIFCQRTKVFLPKQVTTLVHVLQDLLNILMGNLYCLMFSKFSVLQEWRIIHLHR